jgi:hypothetical protein
MFGKRKKMMIYKLLKKNFSHFSKLKKKNRKSNKKKMMIQIYYENNMRN